MKAIKKKTLKDSEYLKDTIINEFTSIDDWNEYIITEKIEILLNKFDLNFIINFSITRFW